jgi:hypothetical protein
MVFTTCEAGAALAFGPFEEWGARGSVSAMAYFHLPLGRSNAPAERTGSFGLAVNSEYQFAHPAYQRETGAYAASTSFGLLGLRFGMDGKLSGFDVGGLNALGTDGAGANRLK